MRRLPHLSPEKLARLRRAFAALSRVSPALAARVLVDQFQRPGRRRTLDAVDAPLLARARHDRVPVGRDAIQVYQWGPESGTTVLLLHGWGSHAPRWSGFVEAILARGWRALAFDAPAHGRSTGRRSNLPGFHAALDAVIGRHGPAHGVIAHSFGALAVATRLADRSRPLPVDAAVLISLPKDAAYLLDLYLGLIEARPVVRRHVLRRFERHFGHPPTHFSALAGASGLAAPLLVIHDRDDEAVPHAHSVEFSESTPAARLLLTDGLGHNRLLRDATVIHRSMDFLAAHVAASV